MSSKQLSMQEPIYHPKKRALFEHKRQSELLKSDTVKHDHVAGESSFKNDFMALKMKLECSQSDIVCMRPRSDSLHSLHSLTSDPSEFMSTASRESSPNMDLFDSRTPERNPTASLNPDISKPLFPVGCESDSSLTDNGENRPNLLTQNLKHDKANGNGPITQSDVTNRAPIDMQQTGVFKRTNNRQESKHQSDYSVDNDRTHVNRPYLNTEQQSEIPMKPNFSHLPFTGTGDHKGSRYVGPMVSLLSRFNKEAVTEHIKSENSTYHIHAEHVLGKKVCTPDTENLSQETARILGNTKDNTLTSDMKIYKCRICNKGFKVQDQLKSHMKEDHSGPQPYKCEHCSRAFSQYNNLQRHLRVHRAKIYKCKLCDREFNEEFYLNMHMGTHTGKRVYSCGVCSASFTSNQDLKLHVKTHSPSQLHTCDVCGKSFSKACVLRQHKKGHSGERPHKCDKCPKTFIHRHHLTMHMRSHSEEKQYSCDICKKEFYQSSHLYKHLKAHEEEGEVSKEIINRMGLNSETSMVYTGADKENTSRKRSNNQNKRNPPKTFQDDKIGFRKTDDNKRTQKLPPLSEAFIVNKQNHAIAPQHQSTLQSQPLKPSSIPYSHPNILTQSLYPNLSSSHNYQHWYPAYHSHLQAYYNNLYTMRYRPNATVEGPGFYGQRQFPVNSLFKTSDKASYHNISGTNTDESLHRSLPKKDTLGKGNTESSLQREAEDEKANTQEPALNTKVDHLKDRLMERCETDQPGMEMQDTCQINFRLNEGKSLSSNSTVEDMVTKSNKNSSIISEEEKASMSNLSANIPQNYDCNKRIPMASIESKLLAGNSTSDPLLSVNSWVSMSEASPVHTTTNQEIFTNKAPVTLDCISPYYMKRPSYPVDRQFNMYPYMNSQQLVSLNPFMMKSPVWTGFDRAEEKPNTTQSLSNSPKKRRYSSQDVYIIKKPLRKEESQLTNRQRHLSECPHVNVATSDTSNFSTGQSQYEHSKTGSCKLVHQDVNLEVSQEARVDPYHDSLKLCDTVEKDSPRNQTSDPAENIKLLTEDKKEFGKDYLNEICWNSAESVDISSADFAERRVVAIKRIDGTPVKQCSSEIDGHEQIFHDMNTALNDSLDEKKLEIDFGVNEKIVDDVIEIDEMRKKGNGRQNEIQKDDIEFRDKHVDTDMNEISNLYEYVKIRQIENVCNETGIPESCDNTGPLDLSLREHGSTVEDNRQSDVDNEKNSIVAPQRSSIKKTGVMDLSVEKTALKLNVNHGKVETEIKVKSSVTRQGMTSDLNNVCGLCWMKFESTAEFEKHQIEHAQKLDESSKCQFCDKVFIRPFDLQCHLLKHRKYDLNDKSLENSGSSVSGINVGTTETKTELQESSERIQSKIALSSIQDEKTFNLSEFERGDSEIQDGLQVYKCDICMREFSHKHNLNRHRMSHSEKCHECRICKRTFKEKFYLQMHIKTHVEEKIRACEICGANVPKSELWKHTNEHLINIVKNPTYKQIGCRVDEIIQGKSVESDLTTDSQTRQVLAERKENMINSDKSLSALGRKRKMLNTDVDSENNPTLAKKKGYMQEMWRINNCKSMRDTFKVKNGHWN